MNNPTQPTTSISFGPISYELIFDFEAVALAEELTDRPLLTGLRQKDIQTPTISLVRAMLFACLHPRHPDLPFDEVKRLVTRKSLGHVWTSVLQVWSSGLAEPDAEDVTDENPPKDQK